MSAPRRIAIVGPYPPFRGGIAQFSEQLHIHLEQAGHEAIGVSYTRQYPEMLFPGLSQMAPGAAPAAAPTTSATQPGAAQPTGPTPTSTPAPIQPTGPTPTSTPAHSLATRLVDSLGPRSWRRAADHIIRSGATEAVLVYWMPFFAPALATIAARLRRSGVRVTALVHNARSHERQPMGEWFARRFFGRCDRLVVLSEGVAQDLRSMGVRGEIKVLFHPVYAQFGPPIPRDEARARLKLGLEPDDHVMLFFGLIRKYKGLDVLIEALGRLASEDPRLKLLVVGEFYEDAEAYERQAAQLGVYDRIHFTRAYAPDADVATWFSAADLVVQPYRSASQSGVVQTAFQFGRPVIVTRVGGLPEMVREGRDALVIGPENPTELADAVRTCFSGGALRTLTEGAREAAARSTWTQFVREF